MLYHINNQITSTPSSSIGHRVAVKILENVREFIEEIEEEFRVLQHLGNHANLPEFYGLYLKPADKETGFPQKDQLWIAMELCAGGSVTDLVKKQLECGEHMPEHLLAHVIRETLQVRKVLLIGLTSMLYSR